MTTIPLKFSSFKSPQGVPKSFSSISARWQMKSPQGHSFNVGCAIPHAVFFHHIHNLTQYCPSNIHWRRWSHMTGSLLAHATAWLTWESWYGQKWLKWSWTSPKYLGASTVQPCDQITGQVKARKACNSLCNLAKTVQEASDPWYCLAIKNWLRTWLNRTPPINLEWLAQPST